MPSSWIYINLGVIVALVVLGAVAVYQANQTRNETHYSIPQTPVPQMHIELDENMVEWHNGFPVLKVEQNKDVSLPLTIKSHTKRELSPELSLTYGPGNAPPVLPDGVSGEFNPPSVELLPQHEAKTSLTLHIDSDASDGTYTIGITALDKKNNESIGTGFTLVIGEGSRFYIGPEGPIGPAPKFERMPKYHPNATLVLEEPVELLHIRSEQVASVVYGVNDMQEIDQGSVLTMHHAGNETNDFVSVTIQNTSNRSIMVDRLTIIGKKYAPFGGEFQDALISSFMSSDQQSYRNDRDTGAMEPVWLGRGKSLTAYIEGYWPDIDGFYAKAHYAFRDGNNYAIKMSQPWWKNEDLGLKLLRDSVYDIIVKNADYNLQISMHYAKAQDIEGLKITVTNIGEYNVKMYGIHVRGNACLDYECEGQFYIMDHRMLGTDSSSPMYPVFEDELELKPKESITSTVTGSWPLPQKFVTTATYSVMSGKPWLDEYRFSIYTTWNRDDKAAERDFNHAGTAVHYYHIYEGMPEPNVYVYKSSSVDRIEDAMVAAKDAGQIIDQRIVIKALEYDPNARMRIDYIATGISATEFVLPKAGYVFTLVPIKLSGEQLATLDNAVAKYGFKLIGSYSGYAIATDQDDNIRVQMKYQNIEGDDNVTISITNISSKVTIIQDAWVSAKNVLDENTVSSKGIYTFIGSKNTVPEAVHLSPVILEPGQTITGSIAGSWPEWQFFTGFVHYQLDEQVIIDHRVTSDVERGIHD